jgi:RNA polymerase sigma-70 factor, ECF subfamily
VKPAIALGQVSSRHLSIATLQSVDLVLLDRIADGDRPAMQALFARYKLSVYRLVLCLVDDEVLAEDILIEVFVDVWRDAKRFEGNSQVSTWIMAIAQSKALLCGCVRRYQICRPASISSGSTFGAGRAFNDPLEEDVK